MSQIRSGSGLYVGSGSKIWAPVSGSTPPAFTPASLTSKVVWVDASVSSNFSLSGSDILSWTNQFAGVGDYALGAASPTWQANYQNGLGATLFDNSSTLQMLNGGTGAFYQTNVGFYMDFVIKPTTEINIPLFFAVNNEVGTMYTCFAVSSNTSYNDILVCFDASVGGFRAATPNGFATDILNKVNRITVTYDGSGLSQSNPGGFKIYLNGTSLSITASGSAGTQYMAQSTLGGWGTSGNRINGAILEGVFCGANQSDANRTSMGTYYSAKWAI
jgi:hypothetical protein